MARHRFKSLVSKCILASFFSTASHGQSIPRFDVEAYCREVSRASGGSEMIYNGCTDMEQAAYDRLKSGWESIPDRARAYCEDVARVTGGSYSIFKGCVEMELDAMNSRKSFEF